PDFLRAILSGYPDRVAQRREPGSPDVLLASGTGATRASESGVRDGDFLVALDVSRRPDPNVARGFQPRGRGSQRAAPPLTVTSDARIRIASRVERAWLKPTASELVHRFDAENGRVRAVAVDYYDALVLSERPAP